MKCMCPCHDVPWAAWNPQHGCPGCYTDHEPPHLSIPKITAANIHAVVDQVSVEPAATINAQRYTMRLHAPEGWVLETVSVVIANELLAHTNVPVKEMLAIELHGFFKKNPDKLTPWLRARLEAESKPVNLGGHLAVNNWLHNGHAIYQHKDYVDGGTVVRDLTHLLPGLQEVVRCPAMGAWSCYHCANIGVVCSHETDQSRRCPTQTTVQRMIVHLNDGHRWKRETEIADWLESLDVDLTFPTEAPPPRPARRSWHDEGSSPLADVMKEVYAKQLAYQQIQMEQYVTLAVQKSANVFYDSFAHADPWPGEHVPGHTPLPPKALALQHKVEQGEHNAKFAVNPTKTRRKKKEH